MKEINNKLKAKIAEESFSYPEEVIIKSYYATKSRHLDLNRLLREHLCGPDEPEDNQASLSGDTPIKEQINNSPKTKEV